MNKSPDKHYVVHDDEVDEGQEPEFKRLSAEEAADWRRHQPRESVWAVVLWQMLLGALLVPLAWLLTRRSEVAWSVAYGVSCIVLPTALMAYGLTSSGLARLTQRLFPGVAGVSLAGLFFLGRGQGAVGAGHDVAGSEVGPRTELAGPGGWAGGGAQGVLAGILDAFPPALPGVEDFVTFEWLQLTWRLKAWARHRANTSSTT